MPSFETIDTENIPPSNINNNILDSSLHKEVTLAAADAAASARKAAHIARQRIAGLDGYLEKRRAAAVNQKIAAAEARDKSRRATSAFPHWTSSVQWQGDVQEGIDVRVSIPSNMIEQVHWSVNVTKMRKNRRRSSLPCPPSFGFDIHIDQDMVDDMSRKKADEELAEMKREALDLEVPSERKAIMEFCQSLDRVGDVPGTHVLEELALNTTRKTLKLEVREPQDHKQLCRSMDRIVATVCRQPQQLHEL